MLNTGYSFLMAAVSASRAARELGVDVGRAAVGEPPELAIATVSHETLSGSSGDADVEQPGVDVEVPVEHADLSAVVLGLLSSRVDVFVLLDVERARVRRVPVGIDVEQAAHPDRCKRCERPLYSHEGRTPTGLLQTLQAMLIGANAVGRFAT